jgi:AP-4 complex subunit mu-1
MYRTNPSIGAHERTHTEAFFRKIKFWNEMSSSEMDSTKGGGTNGSSGYGQNGSECIDDGIKRDPPPVFVMPDGQSYLHVNRNGLIFGCATMKNISPCTVIEVRLLSWHD